MNENSQDNLRLIDIFITLFENRKFILVFTGVFTILGAVAAIIWPKTYTAEATVFPVSSGGTSSLSQYAGLAAMAGINLPVSAGNEASETVSALLGSRLLAEKVVTHLNLVEKLNPRGLPKNVSQTAEFEATAVSIKDSIKTKKNPATGVISIEVSQKNPYLAQSIANETVDVLDKLLMEKNLTTTKKRIENLEQQISAQKTKLEGYQDRMAAFQRETSMLDPKAQSNQVMGAYTSLIQQKMNFELQLATEESLYSSDNPKIVVLKLQIKNLDKQISDLKNQVGNGLPSLRQAPANLIKYQNLATQLEIATKLYAGLLADLEQSKLENDKDQVYITILDRALLPNYGKPSKAMIIVISFLLGFIFSALFVFVRKMVKDQIIRTAR